MVAVRFAAPVTGRDATLPRARRARTRAPTSALEPTERVAQPFKLVAQIAVLPELLLNLSDPRLDLLNDRAHARYLGHHSPSRLTSLPKPRATVTTRRASQPPHATERRGLEQRWRRHVVRPTTRGRRSPTGPISLGRSPGEPD